MEIILDSIKKLLGIEETDPSFDNEIVMHINSAITVLTQLGVGPTIGYRITGSAETWTSFIGTRRDLEIIKSFIYLKVRLLFDPPQNSFLVDSLQEQIKEFEFRIVTQAEPYALTAAVETSEETE